MYMIIPFSNNRLFTEDCFAITINDIHIFTPYRLSKGLN
ncbi:hypothetical protein DCCM_0463 [Desulfocucumis palustris]|uniref:Uncharacterized protein n=1 Tax=Desulfocucumis palustris TaxID=1898651 RepID=A0A2L2X8C2_9FIRM|nr:hypothetical protein DCCM_0463 [Desulfocucumis palustris]